MAKTFRFVGGLLGAAIAACSSGATLPPGEVVVRIDTDLTLSDELTEVQLSLSVAGTSILERTYTVAPATAAEILLPAYLGLVQGEDPNAAVTVRATARKKGVEVVSQRLVVQVPRYRVALMRMTLARSCMNVPCSEDTTCSAGACVPAYVDRDQLPGYDEDEVAGEVDAAPPSPRPPTPSRDAAPESGSRDASVHDAGDGGDIDKAWDCPFDDTTLLVDGRLGDDRTGMGSRDKPYKSVSRALSVVADAGAPRTVCIRGGTAASPLVYSEATTSERFPLDFREPGLTIVGSGRDTTILDDAVEPDGGGTNDSNRSFGVYGDKVTVRHLSMIVNRANAQGVYINGPNHTLNDVHLLSRVTSNTAAAIEGAANMTLINSHIEGGSYTIYEYYGNLIMEDSIISNSAWSCFVDQGGLKATRSTFRDCGNNGVWPLFGTGAEIIDCTFENNQGSGLSVAGNGGAIISVTGSTFRGNKGAGLVVDEPTRGEQSTVTVRNSIFDDNRDGISVSSKTALTVRGSTFRSNRGAGIRTLSTLAVDLGTPGELGNNVLQPREAPNASAGICNEASTSVTARGNRFSRCPVQTSAACVKGVDIGSVMGGVVNATSCVSP